MLLAAAGPGCDGAATSEGVGAKAEPARRGVNGGGDRPAPESRGAPAGPPVAVRFATVETRSAPRMVRAQGSFRADDVATVGAEVAGRIVAVGPEAGDRIEAGAVLAKVDDVDYVLVRDQRRRALEESLAKLGLDALPDGDVDLEKIPSVESARLEAENAAARFERAATLHRRTPPLISDQDFADLRAARDVAESRRRGALLLVRADLAQARTRRAELDAAEERLRDVVHRAPPSAPVWQVAERLVATGDYVAVGAPLYRLVDADPLRLVVRIPERRMAGVAPGRDAV
ncbi:MAG TPA: hypothetical protein VEI02_12015, partial [Planctomycetota bacterium]|nr:hypothetical protein [Planctomycetota bacterium]